MTAKKYTILLISILMCFSMYHVVMYHTITNKVYVRVGVDNIGDLGRLSYSIGSFNSRIVERTLPKLHHGDFNIDQEIDILTIGDSFSTGGGGGVNPYYQDFISSYKNLNVMNIRRLNHGLIETVVELNNAGVLNKLKPKAIILQSVERESIQMLSRDVDWGIQSNAELIYEQLTAKNEPNYPTASVISKFNYNALLYSLLYNFDDNAIFSKVYISELSDKLFTVKNEKQLLFYYADLKNIELSTPQSIARLNSNLNKLQDILRQNNINLYFMPAVDKYNLYSKYLVNSKYDKSQFFELLRKLPKQYRFIDTKSILEKLLDQGVKDVYYSDDTHWSHISSKEIIDKIEF